MKIISGMKKKIFIWMGALAAISSLQGSGQYTDRGGYPAIQKRSSSQQPFMPPLPHTAKGLRKGLQYPLPGKAANAWSRGETPEKVVFEPGIVMPPMNMSSGMSRVPQGMNHGERAMMEKARSIVRHVENVGNNIVLQQAIASAVQRGVENGVAQALQRVNFTSPSVVSQVPAKFEGTALQQAEAAVPTMVGQAIQEEQVARQLSSNVMAELPTIGGEMENATSVPSVPGLEVTTIANPMTNQHVAAD